MATILEFRTLPSRSRVRGTMGEEPCQVVIFPGVRVAYWDDAVEGTDDLPPPSQNASRKSGKQKRR